MSRPTLLPDPFATLVQITAGGLAGSREPTSAPAEAAYLRPDPVEASPRRSLLDRLDDWLWRQRQNDVERSLATAQDVFEVERRQRDERRVLYRYY